MGERAIGLDDDDEDDDEDEWAREANPKMTGQTQLRSHA